MADLLISVSDFELAKKRRIITSHTGVGGGMLQSETRAGQWHMEFVPSAQEIFCSVLLTDKQIGLKCEYQWLSLGYVDKI